jgi:hypothetical protein
MNITNTFLRKNSYDRTQNITHTQEDLVTANDNLVSVMSQCNKVSFVTMKRTHVYSIRFKKKIMTSVKCSLKDRKAWKVIKCDCEENLLLLDERKRMLKVLELLTIVYVHVY